MVGLQVDSVERVIRTQATPVENPYGTVADRDRLWPAPDPNPGTNGSAHGIDAKNDPGAVRNEHAALPRVPRADARQPDRAASDGHGLWGVRHARVPPPGPVRASIFVSVSEPKLVSQAEP